MPNVCAYVVNGRDRVVLINTGFRYGDLRQVVDNLLDMPYDVICTQGHLDHAKARLIFHIGALYCSKRNKLSFL
ncbi:hypothetical protein [Ruoffia sp. FAM 20858]|uniref:hypothetical protein n=1 Tax=unclassified Ruoffia TaxID=2862149 RepID=UPI0038886F6B